MGSQEGGYLRMITEKDLKQIGWMKQSLDNIELQINLLTESMQLHGVAYDGDRVATSKQDRMAEYVAKMTDLQDKWRAKRLRLENLKLKVDAELEKLEPEQANIIRMRYINLWGWKKVCRKANMSYTTAKRVMAAGKAALFGQEKTAGKQGR